MVFQMALSPGAGKNAPARVKANPKLTMAGRPGSRPGSKQQLRADSIEPGVGSQLGSFEADFEQELHEIGRLAQSRSYKSNTLRGQLPPMSPTPPPLVGVEAAAEEEEEEELQTEQTGKDHAVTRKIGKPIHVPYTPDLRARPTMATNLHTHLPAKPMVMRDYQLLAEACQRAGKARMEGHAYYKMGELLARAGETLGKSVGYFQKYLNVCRRLNDLQGEAKALNCIGIAYQEIGGNKNLHTALEYHRQHAEISDAAGIFIANTNMGLIHGLLQDWARAIEHHKQALQYAYRAGDNQAQALALANLGLMGRSQGDLQSAQICMERHLELATTLKDDTASAQAYEQLALLAHERSDNDESARLFTQALDIATQQGNQTHANQLKCSIGIVNGQMKMEEHMRSIARNMGAKTERKTRKFDPSPKPAPPPTTTTSTA
eukprot:TRINITY_DN22760_c0_g1_i1.p1 TRINITY_DN22760_c0_g1~~TRINITY_DN22760_c0_g1_i1.p1  ORF type:complete len:434 (+),score=35.83 TRINITY_DN22760_c0_g1_i1:113-1414(+)